MQPLASLAQPAHQSCCACVPKIHLLCACQLPQNKLGGGEGVEGLYGSIKRSGMDKVGL